MKHPVPRAIGTALQFIFGLKDPSDPSRSKRVIISDAIVQTTALLCGSFLPIGILGKFMLAELVADFNPLIGLVLAYMIFIITWMLYLLSALICVIRRKWITLVVAMPVAHLYALHQLFTDFFGLELNLPPTAVLTVAIVASATSLAWFAQTGRIFSRTFALVFFSMLNIFPWVVAGLLLALCLLLRFFLLAFKQNIEVLRPIGWLRSGRLLLLSALYWAPILMLAIPGYHWVDYSHRYTLGVLTCMVTDPKNNRLGDWAGNCVEEEAGVDRTITEFRQHTKKQTKKYYSERVKKIDAWKAGTIPRLLKQGKKLNPSEAALSAYDSLIPRRINALEPRDCKLFDLTCGAGNMARGSLRASYQSVRNEQRDAFAATLKENSKKNRATQLKEATDAMEDALREVEKAHLKSLTTAFVVLEAVALFCLVTLLIVGLRSLLYVFARVTFGRDAQAYVTLRDDEAQMPHGRVVRAGGELVIDLEQEGEFFAARKYQPQGQAPRYSLPQPGSVPLARILNGSWSLNRLKHRAGSPKVKFSTSQGQEFVVWELADDEVVIFDFKYFVAMSSSLSLYSIISLRISSLLLGKIIFPAARGPGKLVLKTYGKPTRHKADDSIAVSVAPGRLLAWQKNTRFAVDSTLSFVDIYLSGFYLRPQEHELIVIDADRPGERESGLGRFAKNFLMPW